MKSVTIGFIACLTRTGWGAINMPLFIAFLKLPINTAVALSVFTMFPSALPTIIKHIVLNKINYAVATSFLVGAMIESNIGPENINKAISPETKISTLNNRC